MYKIRQLAEEPLEMLEQGVIIAPRRVHNFSNQHGVRQSSLSPSGKHPRSSINQEDQNVVLMIWGKHNATSFLLI